MAEDIPQSVVEAAAAARPASDVVTASDGCPSIVMRTQEEAALIALTAGLAEYERLGWALVPAEAYDPARDPRPGRSFWRDETDEPHPDDVPRPVRDDEATVERVVEALREKLAMPNLWHVERPGVQAAADFIERRFLTAAQGGEG